MSENLSIVLNDHAFQSLASAALVAGTTPAQLAAAVVERAYGTQAAIADPEAARVLFERCFGSVDTGRPIGVANSDIDRDLARAYESSAGTK